MERTIKLTLNQIHLLLDITREDYERQAFDTPMSEADEDLQGDYLSILLKLKEAAR